MPGGRRLVFDEDVFARDRSRFNRYNRSPQLRIEGGNAPAPAALRAPLTPMTESLVALLQRPAAAVEQETGSGDSMRQPLRLLPHGPGYSWPIPRV